MHDCTQAGTAQAVAADRFRKIIADITTERSRQDVKWGEQNHDFPSWLPILMEELGEANRSFLKGMFAEVEAQGAMREGRPVDLTKPAAHLRNFRKEMIETAAVVLAMIECGDRNSWWPA
jgi:hypothetical protein